MDDRKDYVAPAIAAEDVLEQTSLACQASEPFTLEGEAFVRDLECLTDVAKGGAFGPSCTFKVPSPPNTVVLS